MMFAISPSHRCMVGVGLQPRQQGHKSRVLSLFGSLPGPCFLFELISANSIHMAQFRAKKARFYKSKAETPIKPMSPFVRGQRVYKHCLYLRIRKASAECHVHHYCSKSATQIIGFSDPDINRPKIIRDISPVVAVFSRRINNLYNSYRLSIMFGDQLFTPVRVSLQFNFPLPISIRVRFNDMRLFIPMA